MKSSLRRRGISDVGVVPGDLVAEHPHKQGAHGNASNAAQNGLEPFRDPHARQHPTRGRAWATNPAGARVADSDQAATRDPAVRLDNAEGGDRMTLHCETRGAAGSLATAISGSIRDVTKLRGEVALCGPGTLVNDGTVIDDIRKYESPGKHLGLNA